MTGPSLSTKWALKLDSFGFLRSFERAPYIACYLFGTSGFCIVIASCHVTSRSTLWRQKFALNSTSEKTLDRLPISIISPCFILYYNVDICTYIYIPSWSFFQPIYTWPWCEVQSLVLWPQLLSRLACFGPKEANYVDSMRLAGCSAVSTRPQNMARQIRDKHPK